MDLQELIDSVDIVDFISQFVDLEEKNGEYWGISPLRFPPENTPSFSVRRETGSFYCFSTGVGGNAITFLKHYYHISAHEAVERLKKYAGVTKELAQPKKKLMATNVCKKYITDKPKIRASPQIILPDDYMERYEKRKDKLLIWEQEGISKESLEKFQVYYDAYSNRLVYPIRNLRGEIVNVGGRIIDPEWKQKKFRKYTYFYGWNEGMNVIYGLFENMDSIIKSKEVILFEGCKSVLLADTYGIHNCGAILTSHLSPLQMRVLVGLECRVVFALDKDVNIHSDHNINKLKRYVNVEYIHDEGNLLGDKDSPIDRGKEVFQALYVGKSKLR